MKLEQQSMPNLTPENTSVTRADIQGYLDEGMSEDEIRNELTERGLTEAEVEKAIQDLPSYL